MTRFTAAQNSAFPVEIGDTLIRPFTGKRLNLRSIVVVIAIVVSARSATAQTASASAPNSAPRGATVSGVIRDSVAHSSLAEATVQLVAADSREDFVRTSMSDSLGRFTFADVPAGAYKLGFFHAMLDSLGLEAPLRVVRVDGLRPLQVDLAIPSAARIRDAICGRRPGAEPGNLVIGSVHDAADGRRITGARVIARWLEVSLRRNGLVSRLPTLVVTSDANGLYAICDVPEDGTMTLIASHGTDSTDVIEVQLSGEGLIRRELYIGTSRTVMTGEIPKAGDSLAAGPRSIHVGSGTLKGTVTAVVGGQPLAGAQVGIADGPTTRANERGEWTLAEAPTGTRTLEVRALGYYPERRHVDVIPGALPVRVELMTFKAVLDTVRITARRLRGPDIAGFYTRQRSGMGRYLTPEDIARRPAIYTSDLFRYVAGVRVENTGGFDKQILMRGAFGMCSPQFFIDGHHMPMMNADDMDMWVSPKEIEGIEVYSQGTVPPQFVEGLSGCGSIVIWTK